MKKEYEFIRPTLEIILFDSDRDVIATSGGQPNYVNRMQNHNSTYDGLPLDRIF